MENIECLSLVLERGVPSASEPASYLLIDLVLFGTMESLAYTKENKDV